MRSRQLLWAAVLALLAVLLAPATARAVVHIENDSSMPAEFDSRTARVAPTAAQLAAANSLGASVTWNRFGTPASLTKHGGFLTSGVQGTSAAAAARSWLGANSGLFGLGSAADLGLVADNPLRGSKGHAVNFRQVFGGLQTAEGGLVTVGLTGSAAAGWNVAYASSSLTRATGLAPGKVGLTPAQGYVEAAEAAGEDVSLGDVNAAKRVAGWQTLSVEGLDALQRVKQVAFPTPRAGVVPAYESLVVDKAGANARARVRRCPRRPRACTLQPRAQSGREPAAGCTDDSVHGNAPARRRTGALLGTGPSRSAPAFASCASS